MSRTYETKKIIKEEQVITGITCDACKHKINDGCGYWSVTEHHSDWGRDSIDSYSHYDYCSKECLATAFLKYMEDSSTNLGGMNTMQMDIEHMYYTRENRPHMSEGEKNE